MRNRVLGLAGVLLIPGLLLTGCANETTPQDTSDAQQSESDGTSIQQENIDGLTYEQFLQQVGDSNNDLRVELEALNIDPNSVSGLKDSTGSATYSATIPNADISRVETAVKNLEGKGFTMYSQTDTTWVLGTDDNFNTLSFIRTGENNQDVIVQFEHRTKESLEVAPAEEPSSSEG